MTSGLITAITLSTSYFGMLVLCIAFYEQVTWQLVGTWIASLTFYLVIGNALLTTFPNFSPALVWIPMLVLINAVMGRQLLHTKLPLMITLMLLLDAVLRLINGLWGLFGDWLLHRWPHLVSTMSLSMDDWQSVSQLVLGLPTIILIGIVIHFLVLREQLPRFFKNVQTDIYDVILSILFFIVYIVIYYYGVHGTLGWQAYLATIFSVSYGILDLYLLINKNNRLSDRKLMHEVQQYNNLLGQRNAQLHNFNHDYQNILLNMSRYIQNSDLDGLKQYFEGQVDHNVVGKGTNCGPEQLRLINDSAIVGLIYSKYEQAQSRGVELVMTITAPIVIHSRRRVNIVRILGNLLDNAIDAAADANHEVIILVEQLANQKIRFSISNHIPKTEQIDLGKITKNRFTTKEGHFGYGLSSIQQLSDRLIQVTYQVENQVFIARLVIQNEKNVT